MSESSKLPVFMLYSLSNKLYTDSLSNSGGISPRAARSLESEMQQTFVEFAFRTSMETQHRQRIVFKIIFNVLL